MVPVTHGLRRCLLIHMTNKSTTAQARKEVRESKIMTLAVVLFASFAFIGMGYVFAFAVKYISKLFF